MEKLVGVLSPIWIESLHRICRQRAQFGDVPIAAACVDRVTHGVEYAGNQVEQTHNPLAHAECVAIHQMSGIKKSRYLTDVILISSVEPCTMCMGALAHARIPGLIYFCQDEKDGYFTRHGVMVSETVLSQVRIGTHPFWVRHAPEYAEPFQQLLTDFFKPKRSESNSQ